MKTVKETKRNGWYNIENKDELVLMYNGANVVIVTHKAFEGVEKLMGKISNCCSTGRTTIDEVTTANNASIDDTIITSVTISHRINDNRTITLTHEFDKSSIQDFIVKFVELYGVEILSNPNINDIIKNYNMEVSIEVSDDMKPVFEFEFMLFECDNTATLKVNANDGDYDKDCNYIVSQLKAAIERNETEVSQPDGANSRLNCNLNDVDGKCDCGTKESDTIYIKDVRTAISAFEDNHILTIVGDKMVNIPDTEYLKVMLAMQKAGHIFHCFGVIKELEIKGDVIVSAKLGAYKSPYLKHLDTVFVLQPVNVIVKDKSSDQILKQYMAGVASRVAAILNSDRDIAYIKNDLGVDLSVYATETELRAEFVLRRKLGCVVSAVTVPVILGDMSSYLQYLKQNLHVWLSPLLYSTWINNVSSFFNGCNIGVVYDGVRGVPEQNDAIPLDKAKVAFRILTNGSKLDISHALTKFYVPIDLLRMVHSDAHTCNVVIDLYVQSYINMIHDAVCRKTGLRRSDVHMTGKQCSDNKSMVEFSVCVGDKTSKIRVVINNFDAAVHSVVNMICGLYDVPNTHIDHSDNEMESSPSKDRSSTSDATSKTSEQIYNQCVNEISKKLSSIIDKDSNVARIKNDNGIDSSVYVAASGFRVKFTLRENLGYVFPAVSIPLQLDNMSLCLQDINEKMQIWLSTMVYSKLLIVLSDFFDGYGINVLYDGFGINRSDMDSKDIKRKDVLPMEKVKLIFRIPTNGSEYESTGIPKCVFLVPINLAQAINRDSSARDVVMDMYIQEYIKMIHDTVCRKTGFTKSYISITGKHCNNNPRMVELTVNVGENSSDVRVVINDFDIAAQGVIDLISHKHDTPAKDINHSTPNTDNKASTDVAESAYDIIRKFESEWGGSIRRIEFLNKSKGVIRVTIQREQEETFILIDGKVYKDRFTKNY